MSFLKFVIEDKFLLTMLIVVVVLIVLLVCVGLYEKQDWERFSKEHDCKVVRKIKGDTAVTVVPSGKTVGVGVTPISGKTCYLCDDGIEYCR